MPEETSRRVQRVEKQIREILATHLIQEFQHTVDGLISISNVRLSPDLKHGRIYLRVLGTTPAAAKIQQLELLDEIKERGGEIQRYLGKNLGTKFCPKLEFFYDDTLEEALKVEGTLRKLADERKRLHPELAGEPLQASLAADHDHDHDHGHGDSDADDESDGRVESDGSVESDDDSDVGLDDSDDESRET